MLQRRENERAKIPPFHRRKLSSKQKAITSLWSAIKMRTINTHLARVDLQFESVHVFVKPLLEPPFRTQ